MIASDNYYNDDLTLEQAVIFLKDLLSEFPFADWKGEGEQRQSRSRAVQLAAMLSQFAGGCVPSNSRGMGFLWNANTPRSGKTLLAKLAIIPVHGSVAIQSWASKDDELKKILDAEVLRAASYIFFDNVRGHIASQAVEAFITSPMWTGRILGKTEMFTAANVASLFITGNDCTVSSDMAYRMLICDLFVEEANIRERKIGRMIDDLWLMEWKNRHQILSALWAIVRHWDAAGRPPPSSGLPRTGFETWCRTIGGMVEFAGFGDCLEEPELENAGDTELEDVRALVGHLVMKASGKRGEFPFQDLVNMAYQEGLFHWIIKDGKVDEEGDFVLKADANAKLGRLLRKYAPIQGRRVFRLLGMDDVRWAFKVTGKDHSRRYIVERVSE